MNARVWVAFLVERELDWSGSSFYRFRAGRYVWCIGERAVIVATRSSDLGYVSDSYRVRLLSDTQSYVPP